MESIDKVWITILREWICNKLSFFNICLTISSKSAFGISNSQKSRQIIVLEINSHQNLSLDI